MKKTLLMTGCIILLSMSMIFIGCNRDDDDERTNEYVIGSTSYKITDALYEIGNDSIFTLGFVSQGTIDSPTQGFAIYFKGKTTYPEGTYSITNASTGDGPCTAIVINNNVYPRITSGTVIIAKSGDTYTVEIRDGYVDTLKYSFSAYYKGKFTEYIDPDPPTNLKNYFTFNNVKYPISIGGYASEEEDGVTFTAVTLVDSTHVNGMALAFLGKQIQTGTFTFSQTSFTFTGLVIIGDSTYMLTSGSCTIVNNGTDYTINVTNGHASSLSGGSTSGEVTCHYEGPLILLEEKGICDLATFQVISKNNKTKE